MQLIPSAQFSKRMATGTAREKEEVKKLEEELQRLEVDGAPARMDDESKEEEADDEGWVFDKPFSMCLLMRVLEGLLRQHLAHRRPPRRPCRRMSRRRGLRRCLRLYLRDFRTPRTVP